MPSSSPLPLLLLLALTAASGVASVGEPVAKITERMGKPNPQSPRNMAIWFIETNGGPLVYTVTPNARGISIAEGLKPVKQHTLLTEETALGFIQEQLLPFKDSKTARVVRAGEKYEFAKQPFTCAEQEYVLLDEPNGVLLIWNKMATNSSVIVVTPEMLRREN